MNHFVSEAFVAMGSKNSVNFLLNFSLDHWILGQFEDAKRKC